MGRRKESLPGNSNGLDRNRGATAAAFAYLTFMPMTGSQFADYAVSALIVYSGGAIGAIAIKRVEKAIRPRHPVIVGGSQPVKLRPGRV